MNKLLMTVLALVALLGHGIAAAALVGGAPASVTVTAGDGSVKTFVAGDGSVNIVVTGDVVTWTIADFTLAGAGFSGLQFSYDSDPWVSFAVGVNNFGTSALNYVFSFAAPYVGGPYNMVSSELTADVANQELNASLTGISHQTRVDGVTTLTTTLPDCFDPLLDCGTATGSASLLSASAVSGVLQSVLSFTVGGQDIAGLGGRSDLFNEATSVPEPAALPLVLLMLAAMAWHRSPRRRHSGP